MELLLKIPDELLDWATAPERVIHWPIDYAGDVRALLQQEQLDERGLDALLSRLHGLCAEAVRAGRGELLLGFDAATASMLGLVYRAGDVEVGPRDGHPERWTWDEVSSLVGRPPEVVQEVQALRNTIVDVFPEATCEVTEVDDTEICSACGEPWASVMMRTDAGSYCASCWRSMTAPPRRIWKTTHGHRR